MAVVEHVGRIIPGVDKRGRAVWQCVCSCGWAGMPRRAESLAREATRAHSARMSAIITERRDHGSAHAV